MRELTQNDWKTINAEVKAAARRVVMSWPDIVEVDDLQQDMLVNLMESPGTLRRLADEKKENTRMSFLIRLGHRLAKQQALDYEYFHGGYLYDAEEVRGFLNDGMLIGDQPGHLYEEVIDLRMGMDSLRASESAHYATLINRFVRGIKPDRNVRAAHNRISRAVEALTVEMNRLGKKRREDYEGPGNRDKVVPEDDE